MKILILLENDSIQIPNEIVTLQKSLSYPKDTLKISSDTDNTNVTDYDMSIYVYYENPIDTFFKVKLTTENKKILDTEYLSTSDNLPSTIKDIMYLIYNYRKIIITELFTSNTYTMYFFQKYTFNIESDIKVVSTDNHKINAVTDEYIKCFVDSKLETMMKKNDLILKGKNNTYRLVKVDGEYYIEFDSETIKDDAIHYLNETNLKNELQTYLSNLSFNTKPLQDGINNINFEESINARYNEWIKGLRHKNIPADDILDICCKIRHYDDHRQNYYKKLVDVYDDKLAKEKRKQKYKQKDANTESNESKTVKVIDNKPPGSLKDYVYSNDK